ncbi:hypothetical protein [Chryseobacterium sp. KBW03]|nr:hypothetical protein [Chryseobacterium sp. KBW03]
MPDRVVLQFKIKDNVGSILTQERIKRYSDKTPKIDTFDFDSPAVGEME